MRLRAVYGDLGARVSGCRSGGEAETMNAKEGMVLLLTTVFVFLYVLALFGTIRLPSDDKLVAQIAPIITVIIGYYFGRIPGEKNEQTLQQQVNDTGVSGTRRRM